MFIPEIKRDFVIYLLCKQQSTLKETELQQYDLINLFLWIG